MYRIPSKNSNDLLSPEILTIQLIILLSPIFNQSCNDFNSAQHVLTIALLLSTARSVPQQY